jgi:sigma-B regulation protein RsbU (phosphoserine phosphatase)
MPPDAAQALRDMLRFDAAPLVVGILVTAIGIGALLLQGLRRASKDRGLVWFGLFAILYGIRLLITTRLFADLVRARQVVLFLIWAITFTIGIPAAIFAWGLVSSKWNRTIRILIGAIAALAIVAIATYPIVSLRPAMQLMNNVLVIGFTSAFLVYLFYLRPSDVPGLKVLRIGFGLFALFVVYTNLVSANLMPGNAGFEFIGFFIYICFLGYIGAERMFRNEEHLLAIRKELDIARRIQTSILPEAMPELHGLQVAAQYVPMSEVAGDFYEFLVVDEKRLGVLIADVSGHGVPAALVASMVKIAIAAQSEHAEDPAKVMAGLNAVLAGKLQGQFVTAAYLFLDLESGTGSYSAAGHPPLLHYCAADNSIHDIVENGLILGIMPFASYESKSLAVGRGDRFLLYTDGVLEADRRGEEFGPDRVKSILSQSLSAEQLCASLGREVRAWSQDVAGDDITIVALVIA